VLCVVRERRELGESCSERRRPKKRFQGRPAAALPLVLRDCQKARETLETLQTSHKALGEASRNGAPGSACWPRPVQNRAQRRSHGQVPARFIFLARSLLLGSTQGHQTAPDRLWVLLAPTRAGPAAPRRPASLAVSASREAVLAPSRTAVARLGTARRPLQSHRWHLLLPPAPARAKHGAAPRPFASLSPSPPSLPHSTSSPPLTFDFTALVSAPGPRPSCRP